MNASRTSNVFGLISENVWGDTMLNLTLESTSYTRKPEFKSVKGVIDGVI